jgi:hypothetical protein
MKKLIIVGLMMLIGLFSFNSFASDQYLVARNHATGETCIYIAATNWIGPQKICFGVVDMSWEIVTTAYDFDGNGQDDILWRHKPSGAFYVWLMEGFTIHRVAPVLEPLDQNWFLN